MTWQLIKLRGLEAFMFDLTERPAFVHRMMSTLSTRPISFHWLACSGMKLRQVAYLFPTKPQ